MYKIKSVGLLGEKPKKAASFFLDHHLEYINKIPACIHNRVFNTT